ncbi:hypothetical protein AK37_15578 [Rhodococcus pyridinivorans AK37]|uniref:Uncharacterized protein n=1 Tax=Rhodococcus pyridinivorans AK37 TaxID=1114960 RepID=H0JTU6_9NOCA|nr:hypothetical protein AK37_15578 [Rhodococcus pyridinivorans AK37]
MHEIVREKNGDRVFVRLQRSFCATDSMAQAEWLLLDNRFDREQIGRPSYFLEQFELAIRFEVLLEVEVIDEMRYNSVLSGGCHNKKSLSSRMGSFRRDEFDARRVDHRQQLLRHSLCGRQESGAHPRCRNYGCPERIVDF